MYFSDILLDETNSNHLNNNSYNLNDKALYENYFVKMKSNSVSQTNRKLIINSVFKNIDDITYENNQKRIIIEGKNIERLINNQITILPNSLFQFFAYEYYLSLQEIEGYIGETHSVIFDISNKLYSSRIRMMEKV